MPHVSIITTTYRRKHLLGRAVTSVLAQTFTDWEHIIIDDGSNDGTADEIRRQVARDPRIRGIYLEKNGGICRGRNTAIDASAGEWIAFLDDDDEWLPEKLEAQFERIRQRVAEGHPEPGFAYTWHRRIYSDGTQDLDDLTREGDVSREILLKFFGLPSTLIVRRDVFEKAGRFDENLTGSEDYDLLIRAAQISQCACVPQPVVLKYEHGVEQMIHKPGHYVDLADKNRALFLKAGGRARLARCYAYPAYLYYRKFDHGPAVRLAMRAIVLDPTCKLAWQTLAHCVWFYPRKVLVAIAKMLGKKPHHQVRREQQAARLAQGTGTTNKAS